MGEDDANAIEEKEYWKTDSYTFDQFLKMGRTLTEQSYILDHILKYVKNINITKYGDKIQEKKNDIQQIETLITESQK